MNLCRCKSVVAPHLNPEVRMRINIGTTDRLIRVVTGALLVLLPFIPGLALFAEPAWFWASITIGAVLLVTGTVRFCPLYAPFGISTCKAPNR